MSSCYELRAASFDSAPRQLRIALSETHSSQLNEKAPAPIARPRARFSYDDLRFYVVRRKNADANRSFRAGRYARLLLPEVAFLVPGLEHSPILDHNA